MSWPSTSAPATPPIRASSTRSALLGARVPVIAVHSGAGVLRSCAARALVYRLGFVGGCWTRSTSFAHWCTPSRARAEIRPTCRLFLALDPRSATSLILDGDRMPAHPYD